MACAVVVIQSTTRASFCGGHNRTDAAFKYQCKRDGEMETYEAALNDQAKCEAVFTDMDQQSPHGKKWTRRRKFNYAEFRRTFGIRRTRSENDLEEPMTRTEFLLWAQKVKGELSDPAKGWWGELWDGDTEWGNLGRRGQLWR